MNGERADMIFLDPPYDLDYNIDIPISFCAENAAIFLMTSEKNLIKQTYNHLDIFSRMFAVDFRVPNMIANNQCMTRVDFVSYFSIGKSKFNNMHDAFHTLIECFKKHGVNYSQNYGHPQAKNVKLSATFIEHYTMQNEIVLDMFGGSGSTMIACEQLGRKARMMEYEEKYCDIIVARWEQFTGKTAVRI
jgi:DNA modification methylase